jgi:glycerol uptake facilitator-like aquaporin
VHAIVGHGSISHVWLYIVGPWAGAVLAAAIFKVQQTVVVKHA